MSNTEVITEGRATKDGRCLFGHRHSWALSIVDNDGRRTDTHYWCTKCDRRVAS